MPATLDTPAPTAVPSATGGSPPSAPEETVAVGLGDLIVGRTVRKAIYDASGLLLLAEGVTITSEFKHRLRERGMDQIVVPKKDVAEVALNPELFRAHNESPLTLALNNELSKKLDTIIESGSLFVANTGPALRDSRVFHGCQAYNAESRERLVATREQSSKQLDGMMQQVFQGERPDANQLNQVVATYLTELPQDSDNVLTVASELSRERDLSDHCLDMSVLGMALAMEMGMDAPNVRTVGLVGMVHDWSMLGVPAQIRAKQDRLTEVERLEIHKHPIRSLEFLQRINGLKNVVSLVSYQVHERPNGKGYPRGRTKQSIHPFARILAVADAYVSLTHPRPWRPAYTPYSAMEILIRKSAQRDFDQEVVRHLVNLLSLFPLGSFVVLSDGSVGRVLRRNGDSFSSPIVQIVQDPDGNPLDLDDPILVDLLDGEVTVVQALPTPGRNERVASPQDLTAICSS